MEHNARDPQHWVINVFIFRFYLSSSFCSQVFSSCDWQFGMLSERGSVSRHGKVDIRI